MSLPSFIIAGAPKCGTTSLVYYLRAHPDICMPREEPCFFNADENFAKGLEWYEQFFSSCGDAVLFGEKTPGYMFSEKSMERIHEILPGVKLIFLLRHPADRSYSEYWHRRRNRKTDYEFEEIVDRELEGNVPDDPAWPSGIIDYSRYTRGFEPVREHFPDERILVLRTEELKDEREKILGKVLDFLGVEMVIPDNIAREYNIGHSPKRRFKARNKVRLQKILAKISIYRKLKRKPLKGEYPDMGSQVRKKLETLLADEIETWRTLDYFR